jgi:hypothetical protein
MAKMAGVDRSTAKFYGMIALAFIFYPAGLPLL